MLQAFRQNAAVIPSLEVYLMSGDKKVQKEALRLTTQIGKKHQYAISRIQAVNQLLKASETLESALLGQVAKSLQQFKRNDFDEAAEKQLTKVIKMERQHLSKFIELAGFLQMHEFLEELRFQYKDNKYLRQSIGIALTRCGDEQKRNNLMKNVAKYRVNDEFVYSILPKLVYARQKETTNYLFDIILKDHKGCSSSNHDHGHSGHDHHHTHDGHNHEHASINCAYRVMEAIAPYVKDIPLHLSASGDLMVTDYKQALQTTRDWITANRDQYELNTDIY